MRRVRNSWPGIFFFFAVYRVRDRERYGYPRTRVRADAIRARVLNAPEVIVYSAARYDNIMDRLRGGLMVGHEPLNV